MCTECIIPTTSPFSLSKGEPEEPPTDGIVKAPNCPDIFPEKYPETIGIILTLNIPAGAEKE